MLYILCELLPRTQPPSAFSVILFALPFLFLTLYVLVSYVETDSWKRGVEERKREVMREARREYENVEKEEDNNKRRNQKRGRIREEMRN